MMDYLCDKFGSFSFWRRFGSIVRTARHTDRHEGFTPATLVSVSNTKQKRQTEHTNAYKTTSHKLDSDLVMSDRRLAS